MTKNEIKQRIVGHRQSFRDRNKKAATTLSAYVWDKGLNMNQQNTITEPNIKWTIVQRCHLYRPGGRTCNLCLSEKFHIIKNTKNRKCINKRQDISAKCSHTKGFKYKDYN